MSSDGFSLARGGDLRIVLRFGFLRSRQVGILFSQCLLCSSGVGIGHRFRLPTDGQGQIFLRFFCVLRRPVAVNNRGHCQDAGHDQGTYQE